MAMRKTRQHSRYSSKKGTPARPLPFATGGKERGKKEITLTPTVAEEWLRHSYGNRVIRDEQVALLRREIEDGKFSPFVRSGIVWDQNGFIRDGHHTLHAIRTGTRSQAVTVKWGLNELECSQIDSNVGRTAKDYAQIKGIEHAGEMTSLAKAILSYEAGCPIDSGHFKPATDETYGYVVANQEELQSVLDKAHDLLADPAWRKRLQPRALAFFILMIRRASRLEREGSEEEADFFLEMLFGLGDSSLKEDLYRPLTMCAEGHKNFQWAKTYGAQLVILCTAWNRFRAGVTTKFYAKNAVTRTLRKAHPEPFPFPDGYPMPEDAA